MPTQWRPVLLLFLVALVSRAGVIVAGVSGIGPLGAFDTDPDSYRLIAETLANSGVFGLPTADGSVDPTAFRPPLYPWLLSWLVLASSWFFGGGLKLSVVALLHVLLGVGTSLATYGIASRLFSSQRIGFIAGTLVAIDPLLLQQSTLIMTETLATALAVAAWFLLGKSHPSIRDSFAAAALLAIAFLCRPTFIVWTALIAATMLACALFDCRERRAILRRSAIIVLIPALAVSLWAFRNWNVLDKPVWATTHGGYTMLLGNNPYIYDHLEAKSLVTLLLTGNDWDPTAFHQDWEQRLAEKNIDPNIDHARDSEIHQDALAADWSRKTIRERPGLFLYSAIGRVIWLWTPFPNQGSAAIRYLIAVYYLLIYAACLISLFRNRDRLLTPIATTAITLVLSLTIVHAVYWSNIRMRSPAVPVLSVFAAGLFAAGRNKPSELLHPASFKTRNVTGAEG